uniref:Uncharacterized protein n=1 Tax=Prymnesium polylepis TaxID=72548 RepID=A0A7S4IZA3_9EUKA
MLDTSEYRPEAPPPKQPDYGTKNREDFYRENFYKEDGGYQQGMREYHRRDAQAGMCCSFLAIFFGSLLLAIGLNEMREYHYYQDIHTYFYAQRCRVASVEHTTADVSRISQGIEHQSCHDVYTYNVTTVDGDTASQSEYVERACHVACDACLSPQMNATLEEGYITRCYHPTNSSYLPRGYTCEDHKYACVWILDPYHWYGAYYHYYYYPYGYHGYSETWAIIDITLGSIVLFFGICGCTAASVGGGRFLVENGC